MQLSEAQRQIQATARAFAEREIAPFAAEWDRAEGAPREVLWKMAQAGLMGVTIDPAHGGAGADFVSYVLAIEEIAAADGGLSNMMAANNSPVGTALAEHGSERQKTEYLSSADLAMIVAVTDPEAGKRGISTFVTPTDNPGYKVIAKERKLGHRTNDTCQVVFEDMVVPKSDLLGAPGRGLGIALANLSAGRIGAAAQSTGGARAALKAAIAYARERETFGRKIIGHQAIAFKLADMATQVEAARQLYLHAAMLKDRGVDCAREASMAKLFASEMAERVASEAIQIHGGYGFLNDFPVEKIYRDVRVYQIYEGTSEVQRMLIARTLDGLDL